MGASADGSSLHADWFGAWDPAIQSRWFNSCLMGLRSSNNGNLCDGQSLSGSTWSGALLDTTRLPGFTPTPQ